MRLSPVMLARAPRTSSARNPTAVSARACRCLPHPSQVTRLTRSLMRSSPGQVAHRRKHGSLGSQDEAHKHVSLSTPSSYGSATEAAGALKRGAAHTPTPTLAGACTAFDSAFDSALPGALDPKP